MPTPLTVSDDQLDALVEVLDLVRKGAARTRPDIGRVSGLGRTVVTQRVTQLMEAGLVVEGALGPSTGGRAPRGLVFRSDAGQILVAELGATSLGVALTDLSGEILDQYEEVSDISAGPQPILDRVEELFDRLQSRRPAGSPPVWGIGMGVPGPVEFATGRPVAPPIMPGWDNYPVRDRLAQRYQVPTWVDNDVNVMAFGELRAGLAVGERDILFVKVGTGIGSGLVSGGRLHRGAQGAAGDIGHVAVPERATQVCRCGNVGCLEAVAGGFAIARDATSAALVGRSPFLVRRAQETPSLSAADVAAGARYGDPFCVELLTQAGSTIGRTMATLVSFYNPSLIVLGGGVANSGDLFLAAIRQAVYLRSLPLATRDLRIARSLIGDEAGLRGAAFVVIDELFARGRLAHWIASGTPVGRPELAEIAA